MTATDYTVQTQELKLKVSEFGQLLLSSQVSCIVLTRDYSLYLQFVFIIVKSCLL